jgi:hypothetical protein
LIFSRVISQNGLLVSGNAPFYRLPSGLRDAKLFQLATF